jgi:hypothetical protein
MLRTRLLSAALALGLLAQGSVVMAQEASPSPGSGDTQATEATWITDPPHPVQIQTGTCAAPGAVVASLTSVQALQQGTDVPLEIGSTREVRISVQDLLEGRLPDDLPGVTRGGDEDGRTPLSIGVLASADQLGGHIACGDIFGSPDEDGVLVVPLYPVDDSGHSGYAWMSDEHDTTVDVVLSSAGATTGAEGETATADLPHPAHIHAGTCASPGDIVAPLSDVQALSPDGTSGGQVGLELSSTREVGMSVEDLLEGRIPDDVPGVTGEPEEDGSVPLSINVHASADDLATYLACGDIHGAPGEDGVLVVVLRDVGGSGHSGYAWISEEDGTTVDIILAPGPVMGDEGAAGESPTPTESPAVEESPAS